MSLLPTFVSNSFFNLVALSLKFCFDTRFFSGYRASQLRFNLDISLVLLISSSSSSLVTSFHHLYMLTRGFCLSLSVFDSVATSVSFHDHWPLSVRVLWLAGIIVCVTSTRWFAIHSWRASFTHTIVCVVSTKQIVCHDSRAPPTLVLGSEIFLLLQWLLWMIFLFWQRYWAHLSHSTDLKASASRILPILIFALKSSATWGPRAALDCHVPCGILCKYRMLNFLNHPGNDSPLWILIIYYYYYYCYYDCFVNINIIVLLETHSFSNFFWFVHLYRIFIILYFCSLKLTLISVFGTATISTSAKINWYRLQR